MSKILKAFVSSCIILICSGNLMAVNKSSSEFLTRQLEFYSPVKAQESIKQGDFTKAAINALSIYPISSKDAIYIALLLEKEIKRPLPDFLFKAYQEMGIASDPSVKLEKDGESVFVEEWVSHKAKWSDDKKMDPKAGCNLLIYPTDVDVPLWGSYRGIFIYLFRILPLIAVYIIITTLTTWVL